MRIGGDEGDKGWRDKAQRWKQRGKTEEKKEGQGVRQEEPRKVIGRRKRGYGVRGHEQEQKWKKRIKGKGGWESYWELNFYLSSKIHSKRLESKVDRLSWKL